MGCDIVRRDGVTAIVCTRGRGTPEICEIEPCGRPGEKLCDWPKRSGKGTCDFRMCVTHAHHVPPDLDYCPAHRLLQAARGKPR